MSEESWGKMEFKANEIGKEKGAFMKAMAHEYQNSVIGMFEKFVHYNRKVALEMLTNEVENHPTFWDVKGMKEIIDKALEKIKDE